MKIIRLTAENVKRLSAVEITPDGKTLVLVSGKNAAGKSSVLDSIMFALAGGDSLPSKPVRKGEDKATVELDLGDFIVTRTMTATGGGTLTVRNKDGIKQTTPQKILDGLLGRLTFDPLKFRNEKAEQRSLTLQALVGLDFTEQEKDADQLFNERTIANRELKAIEARLGAIKEYPDAPKEEQSAAAIVEEQRKASAQNAENFTARQDLQCAKRGVSNTAEAVNDLKRNLVLAEERFKAASELLDRLNGRQIPADVDLAPFADRVKEVEQTNLQVRQNRQKSDLREAMKVKRKASEDLTRKLDAIEKFKRDAVQSAKFPVEGLSLSDTKEVMFNGIPFDQCSTAEQLSISVAMGLKMNSKLRVLLIKQGNDLDTDNLRLIAEMAAKEEAQIWMERVVGDGVDGAVSVVIEDGHVAGQDYDPDSPTDEFRQSMKAAKAKAKSDRIETLGLDLENNDPATLSEQPGAA